MNNAIVTCSRNAGLREMGRLMASHHIHSLVMSLGDPARWRPSHLIVTDTESGQPTGITSALDIAGIVGWGED